MNSQKRSELIRLEAKLYKSYRVSFFCAFLILMVMILFVMFSLISGQPVDQKAVAEAGTPFLMLMLLIGIICNFFHAGVKAKLTSL